MYGKMIVDTEISYANEKWQGLAGRKSDMVGIIRMRRHMLIKRLGFP